MFSVKDSSSDIITFEDIVFPFEVTCVQVMSGLFFFQIPQQQDNSYISSSLADK